MATLIFNEMIEKLGPMDGKSNLTHNMSWYKFYNWTIPPSMIGEVEFVNGTRFSCKFITKVITPPKDLYYACLWCPRGSELDVYDHHRVAVPE